MRVEAQAWAVENGLQFAWDNSSPLDEDRASTLVWEWRESVPVNLTLSRVLHQGTATGRIVVEAAGGLAAVTLATSLRDRFAGKLFGGGEAKAAVEIRSLGRQDSTSAMAVIIPWEIDLVQVPLGRVAAGAQATELSAYQAFRARWEQRVRAPLGLPSFFDDSPPKDTDNPPWALCGWRTFRPVQIEQALQRVPGRVIAALSHRLGTGVREANLAAGAIVRAFHECSFGGLVFGTAEVSRIGRSRLNTWQTNVRLPFHYDQRT